MERKNILKLYAVKKCWFIFLWAMLLFISKNAAAQISVKKAVPVIELTGNPYQRGWQHGTTLKNEIAAVFAKWKDNIRRTGNHNPDSLLTAFNNATDFEAATRKYTPAILEELKGIADGSGQSYQDVYSFQLVDEFWVYLDKQFNTGGHHCSGIGVPATANHPAYIAQNMDLENYMNGFQVLFHIPGGLTEPGQLILSCAGLVALNGMNNKGIAVCVNTLMELQAVPDGLPVAFVIRGLLSQQNGNDVLQFLKKVPHASGQNYILGIEDSVYDFEASSNQVVRFFPGTGESSVVYHTNHALVNHDVKKWYEKYHEQVLRGETKGKNSEIRYASLQGRLNINPSAITTDLIKVTLRSKDDPNNPVCRLNNDDGRGFTFSSVLFTLGSNQSVQLTNGSPDQAEYVTYYFDQN